MGARDEQRAGGQLVAQRRRGAGGLDTGDSVFGLGRKAGTRRRRVALEQRQAARQAGGRLAPGCRRDELSEGVDHQAHSQGPRLKRG